jgi:hypothetical protein
MNLTERKVSQEKNAKAFFDQSSRFTGRRTLMSSSPPQGSDEPFGKKNYLVFFFCSCFTIRAWMPK